MDAVPHRVGRPRQPGRQRVEEVVGQRPQRRRPAGRIVLPSPPPRRRLLVQRQRPAPAVRPLRARRADVVLPFDGDRLRREVLVEDGADRRGVDLRRGSGAAGGAAPSASRRPSASRSCRRRRGAGPAAAAAPRPARGRAPAGRTGTRRAPSAARSRPARRRRNAGPSRDPDGAHGQRPRLGRARRLPVRLGRRQGDRAGVLRRRQPARPPAQHVLQAGQPVPRPAGAGELVPLAGEQQELGGDAAALELDVEPRALLDRAAPVLLGVDDQRRGGDRRRRAPARSARRSAAGSVPR